MPTYSNVPPEDGRGHALQLRRTPARSALVAIATSEDLAGCPTHFYKGRTRPCETPDCEPCHNGVPWRWHGYLSAWEIATGQHFLFEFTARVAELFVAHRNAYKTIRGCQFEAKRVNSTPNARVALRTRPADLEKYSLPDPPNIIACLAIIWNLATPTLAVIDALKQIPRIRVRADGNGQPVQILDGT